MEKNILTTELENHLIDYFETRATKLGYQGKKKISFQAEFLIGACAALDKISGTDKTCVPPGWYVNIIRGQLIEKQPNKPLTGTR